MNPESPIAEPRPSGQMSLLRRIRWYIPAAIIVLEAANIVRINAAADLDSNFKNMQTFFSIPAVLILLLVWWMFLTRLRWRVRFAGVGLLVLLLFGLKQVFRFDGSVDGTGKPHIVWRWAPRKSGEAGDIKIVPAAKVVKMEDSDIAYPGFLGRSRNGVVSGANLDRDWTAHPPRELWRQPVGLGWSGFVVSAPLAITQEQRGQEELIVCYELTSGHTIWVHTNDVRFSEPMGGDGPRATATISGDRVYALGATGILDCFDAATGKSIWSRETLKSENLPNTYFGKSSSPLVVDDLVVIGGGMTNHDSLLAFNTKDGSPAWSTGTDKAAYSSPMIATFAGVKQIVSLNASSLTGHDIKDGKVLWDYAWGTDKWPKCVQPVLLDQDRILISSSFGLGTVLLGVKQDAAGKFSVNEVWKSRFLKSEFANVVVRNGYAYGLDDGILTCIDLADGARKWKDGHYGHGQLLLADDLLIVQTEAGPVALVEAKPDEFHELATLKGLGAKTWNVPALAGDYLLIRNDQEAACYQLTRRLLTAEK